MYPTNRPIGRRAFPAMRVAAYPLPGGRWALDLDQESDSLLRESLRRRFGFSSPLTAARVELAEAAWARVVEWPCASCTFHHVMRARAIRLHAVVSALLSTLLDPLPARPNEALLTIGESTARHSHGCDRVVPSGHQLQANLFARGTHDGLLCTVALDNVDPAVAQGASLRSLQIG